jgi:hypothetical protein
MNQRELVCIVELTLECNNTLFGLKSDLLHENYDAKTLSMSLPFGFIRNNTHTQTALTMKQDMLLILQHSLKS